MGVGTCQEGYICICLFIIVPDFSLEGHVFKCPTLFPAFICSFGCLRVSLITDLQNDGNRTVPFIEITLAEETNFSKEMLISNHNEIIKSILLK